MAQVHVLTGPERRRRFSLEQKRAIVAAAFAPGPWCRTWHGVVDDEPPALHARHVAALLEAFMPKEIDERAVLGAAAFGDELEPRSVVTISLHARLNYF
jgi:hypothetical protein